MQCKHSAQLTLKNARKQKNLTIFDTSLAMFTMFIKQQTLKTEFRFKSRNRSPSRSPNYFTTENQYVLVSSQLWDS
jgi:hypothetical protein